MTQPPHGMSEHDYEAIEAAVTETVRGRWFLNEFARRNRAGELRQILDAMTRLEGAVATGQAALPPADPSVRLIMQRVREIAGQLDGLADEMRAAGAAEAFARSVENQARAVAGMLRGPALPSQAAAKPAAKPAARHPAVAPPDLPSEPLPKAIAAPPASEPPQGAADPRLRLLDELDRLPLTEKLRLFA